LCILLASLSAACSQADPGRQPPYDLIRDVAPVFVRPVAPAQQVRTETVTIDGATTPTLLMTAPSRVTWALRFPRPVALFGSVILVPTSAATPPAGVVARIRMSNNRTYDDLLQLTLQPGSSWQSVHVDLSPYSGWKWSLFYRPSTITWSLIVNADLAPGGTIAWRELAIR
jgi:hypothetical protein